MNQAAKWVDQALEKNPDAYFMHMRRAQIQAKLGNKKEADRLRTKGDRNLKTDKEPDEIRDQIRAADNRQLEVAARQACSIRCGVVLRACCR